MKVIFLKDVPKLGKRYETKEVSDGHALNMLIPRGFAVAATPDAIKRISVEKSRIDGERKLHEDLLIKNIMGLDGKALTVAGKANDKGHLFAGLHREEIAAEIARQTELQIDPSSIGIDHPIKELGEHIIKVSGGGKSVTFKLVIEKK